MKKTMATKNANAMPKRELPIKVELWNSCLISFLQIALAGEEEVRFSWDELKENEVPPDDCVMDRLILINALDNKRIVSADVRSEIAINEKNSIKLPFDIPAFIHETGDKMLEKEDKLSSEILDFKLLAKKP